MTPRFLPGLLNETEQSLLLQGVVEVLCAAPPFRPTMPKTGKPFSVLMSNCGPLGWVSDRQCYRYQASHPITGRAWPDMPADILRVWNAVSGYPDPPEACLINLYGPGARMGLHRDADEAALDAPVVSISLGAGARFRFGGPQRGDATRSVKISGGDVLILGGEARLIYHGIDKVVPGPALALGPGLEDIVRVNLTLRRVTRAGSDSWA